MSVFVVLALIWAAVLVPPALRARAEQRAEFIESFREQMGALGSRRQAVVGAPRGRRRTSAAKRRRDILGGLLGAMLGSLLLGAVPSLRMAWIVHLFLLNSFIGYCCLLASRNNPSPRRATAATLTRVTPAFEATP